MANAPRSRRRPTLQEERSEETRARLRRATIESLVEVGYAGTSMSEIADRAGISRGALIHHYPSKAVLVSEAVAGVLDDRHEELTHSLEELPPDARPEDCVELIWLIAEGWAFKAWLEVVVASRTDSELRAAVMRETGPWVESVKETVRRYIPATARNPVLQDMEFVFAIIDGVALSVLLYPDVDGPARMVGIVKELVRLTQPEPSVMRAPSGGPRSRARK